VFSVHVRVHVRAASPEAESFEELLEFGISDASAQSPVVRGGDCFGNRVRMVTSRVYKSVVFSLLAGPNKHGYSVILSAVREF